MARVVWSSVARDDLKAVVAFINADSPSYAQTFGLHIQQRWSNYATSPNPV